MEIHFSTDVIIGGNQKQVAYFSAQIADDLSRYQSHISRLEVHLSDGNAEKDGFNDILCILESRVKGGQPIAVTCEADTVALAVFGATEKFKNSLDSIFGYNYKLIKQ